MNDKASDDCDYQNSKTHGQNNSMSPEIALTTPSTEIAQPTAAVYHEKQIRELCALHTLNNLFQEKLFFTKAELDEICKQLSPDQWINPHRSILGLGNYDINVIMAALERKGHEAIWFDKRKHPSSIDVKNTIGFILNVPTDYRIGFISVPLKRRHWIAIKKIGIKYWNLDSKLDRPQNLGDENELIAYLANEMDNKEKELFVVQVKCKATIQPATIALPNDTTPSTVNSTVTANSTKT